MGIAIPIIKCYDNRASTFEFFFTINVLHEIFTITGHLSQALQDLELDIIFAQDLVSSTIKALATMRTETNFESVFNTCIEFANKIGVQAPMLKRQAAKPL